MMSTPSAGTAKTRRRPVGGTELSWCKAVPGGTGITVLALLFSKPIEIPFLQNLLHKLQTSHPILNSKLHYDFSVNSFSFISATTPYLQIQHFDPESTCQILQAHDSNPTNSPFHLIFEHELSKNSWENLDPSSDADLFFASVYALQDDKCVVALRLHTSLCDRASTGALRREFLELLEAGAAVVVEGIDRVLHENRELSLAIEECIPGGQGYKPFWARGMDMLGYSLNSFRFSNLSFVDSVSPRVSRIVRMQLNAEETGRILSKCESRAIKLSGLLTASGLMASCYLKGVPDYQWEKYAVVTLINCRSILNPALSIDHIGFYHSAILNTHDLNGGENLWELAKRVYTSYVNAKNNNKHFTDMADLNFLMCKAIENPGLTPSGSLRTSLISVFEDSLIDDSSQLNQVTELEDYLGCGSVHGVGPSIAIFDTIRNGKLDCAFVYPFPLHSREQMQEFVDEIKQIILD